MSANQNHVSKDLEKEKKLQEKILLLTQQNLVLTDDVTKLREIYRKAVDSTRDVTDTLTTANSEYQNNISDLQKEVAEFRVKMDGLSAEIKNLENDKKSISQKLNGKESDLSTEKARYERLVRDNAKLTETTNSLKAENDKYVIAQQSLKDTHNGEKQAADKLLSTLQSQHDQLRTEHNSKSNKLSSLEALHRSTTLSLTKSQDLHTETTAKHKSELNDKTRAIDELTTERDTLKRQLANTQNDLTLRNGEYSKLQQTLVEITAECERLKKQEASMRTSHEAELEVEQEKATEFSIRLSAMNLEANLTTVTFDKLNSKITELTKQRARVQTELRAQITAELTLSIRKQILAEIEAKNRKDGHDSNGASPSAGNNGASATPITAAQNERASAANPTASASAAPHVTAIVRQFDSTKAKPKASDGSDKKLSTNTNAIGNHH